MTRCQKCYSKIRKLAGNPGKGSKWGCRRCLGILKMKDRPRYTLEDRRLAEILRKAPLSHH